MTSPGGSAENLTVLHQRLEAHFLALRSRRDKWGLGIPIFALEHGPYWDVGLAAGALYNWWMLRTRSLGDLMISHAATNACLSAYVIWSGRWEYWL